MSDKSPDAFRTISEVADWLGVQPHVLRFWESKFSQVRPVKRAGGRRYYRPNDMLLLGGIRKLLHEDGLTIKGAQKVLREEGMAHVARMSQPLDAESAALSEMVAAMEEAERPAREGSGEVLEFDHGRPEPDLPRTAPAGPAGPALPAETAAAQTAARPSLSETPQPEGPEEQEIAADGDQAQPPASPARQEEHAQEEAPEKAPLPSFMRDPASRRPPPTAAQEPPVSDRLPSFLQPPKPAQTEAAPPRQLPAAEAEAELPLDFPTAQVHAESAPEPEPAPAAAPKPKIVEAPDPDESAFEVAPGALSAAFAATAVPHHRRAEILPLVARLAALRDRMAAGRSR